VNALKIPMTGSFISVFLLIQLNPTLRSGLPVFVESEQVFVDQYSPAQLSYHSPSPFELPSPSQSQQGRLKAVTIQFPPKSANGESRANAAF
jgi:hypothetical protein